MNNPVTNVSKSELFQIISKITGATFEDLFLDSEVAILFKGNVHKLGVVLYDLHELTEKEIDYSEDDLALKFRTIQDIVDYFELD